MLGILKSRLHWAGQVAQMCEKNVCRILQGNILQRRKVEGLENDEKLILR
jgi:hypothetical protein